jgi:hypothetical protein
MEIISVYSSTLCFYMEAEIIPFPTLKLNALARCICTLDQAAVAVAAKADEDRPSVDSAQ